jgi:hypothetical protein
MSLWNVFLINPKCPLEYNRLILKYKIIRSQINLGLQQPFFSVNYQGIKRDRNRMLFLYEMNTVL